MATTQKTPQSFRFAAPIPANYPEPLRLTPQACFWDDPVVAHWVASYRFSRLYRLPLAAPPASAGIFLLYTDSPFFGPVLRYVGASPNLRESLNVLRYAQFQRNVHTQTILPPVVIHQLLAENAQCPEDDPNIWPIYYAYRQESDLALQARIILDIRNIYESMLLN